MKKLVVLTGCTGGLGRELLNAWSKATEYQLAFLVRKPEEISGTLAEHKSRGALVCGVDLLDEAGVLNAAELIQKKFGAPWGVVNLAGVGNNGLSWKMNSSEFSSVLNGNLLTAFNVMRSFLPAMRSAGRGRIVNVSSVVAATGVFGASAYVAAKSGIEGLTRAVALENASKGITVNSLALGYFNAGMIESVPENVKQDIVSRTPVGRLGEGADLAGVLDFLLDERSAFVTGQTIAANGGLHFR